MNLASVDLVDISNVVGGGSGVGLLQTPWVSGDGNKRAHVTVGLGAGADVITVTALQATDASGTGSKELLILHAYIKYGNDINFTRIDGGSVVTLNDVKAGIAVIEFALFRLDINNGFNHFAVKLSGSSTRQQHMVVLPMGGRTIF